MHRDTVCGSLRYDGVTGRIAAYRDAGTGQSPFFGNSDYKKIQKWWEMRSVPASRSALQELLRSGGYANAGVYLAKNFALSMVDDYWIRPKGSGLTFGQVGLKNLAMLHEGRHPYHNDSSYDPNASLGGQMDKYWEFGPDGPVLVKEGYRFFGQQSVNEAFATHLHQMQGTDVPFVHYSVSMSGDRGVLCKCPAFVPAGAEFVPAYEVVESRKQKNDVSLYDGYIDACVSLGMDRGMIRDFINSHQARKPTTFRWWEERHPLSIVFNLATQYICVS